MYVKMGCLSSTELDPNIMYKEGEGGKLHLQSNGLNKPDYLTVDNKKQLKGDTFMRHDARLRRSQRVNKQGRDREAKAMEMSERAMDEREMLSLISSRANTPRMIRASMKSTPAPSQATTEYTTLSISTASIGDRTKDILELSSGEETSNGLKNRSASNSRGETKTTTFIGENVKTPQKQNYTNGDIPAEVSVR